MEARCQCGAIRLRCPSDKPLRVYACHCNECRRQSGSAFSLSAIFPYFDFKQDGMSEYKRITLAGKVKQCYFCSACGSRLIHAREGKDVLTVKAGCLTALSKEMIAGAIHLWTEEAVAEIPAGVESYLEDPPNH